jgi:hypothetical protein
VRWFHLNQPQKSDHRLPLSRGVTNLGCNGDDPPSLLVISASRTENLPVERVPIVLFLGTGSTDKGAWSAGKFFDRFLRLQTWARYFVHIRSRTLFPVLLYLSMSQARTFEYIQT